MARLDVDFTDVALEMKAITPGVYVLRIEEVPEIQPNKAGTGNNLVVRMRIDDEGEFKDRMVADYKSLANEWLWRVNQLREAAGIPANKDGIDLEEFVGKLVKAELSVTVSKDTETGEQREFANVKRYLYAKGKAAE